MLPLQIMHFLGYNNSFESIRAVCSTHYMEPVAVDSSFGCWSSGGRGPHLSLAWVWSTLLSCLLGGVSDCSASLPSMQAEGSTSKVTGADITSTACVGLCEEGPELSPFANGPTETQRGHLSRVTQDVLEVVVPKQTALHHHPVLSLFTKMFS